jgi:hypothetical protein
MKELLYFNFFLLCSDVKYKSGTGATSTRRKLITAVHVTLSTKTPEVLPPCPLYAFVAWFLAI